MKPVRIYTPDPPIGARSWLLQENGLFVLAEGPGMYRGFACTHAGSGSIEVRDGVPNDHGFFPDADMKRPTMPDSLRAALCGDRWGGEGDPRWEDNPEWIAYRANPYWTRNGRPIFRDHPVVMGMWMMDAGFIHGLTVLHEGGHNCSAIGTLCWVQHKPKPAVKK